jgi:hypothetical protein
VQWLPTNRDGKLEAYRETGEFVPTEIPKHDRLALEGGGGFPARESPFALWLMLILRSLGRFNSATIRFSRAIGLWMANRRISISW